MNRVILVVFVLSFVSVKAQQNMFVPTVLVEFFSSEGCSSCPQADEFGSEIRKIADSTKQRVFTLDWHVDLWDKSGWKDPYSDSTYTKRQERMAKANKQLAVFTPMVFVNGKGALPAGAKSEVGKLIESNLRQPAQNFIMLKASWIPDERKLQVDYELKGKLDSVDLSLVLSQNEAYSMPSSGENMGKKLIHHNVVRKVETNSTPAQIGTMTMQLASSEVDFTKFKLIVFLQHKPTKQIFACQQLDFDQK